MAKHNEPDLYSATALAVAVNLQHRNQVDGLWRLAETSECLSGKPENDLQKRLQEAKLRNAERRRESRRKAKDQT